MTATKTKTATRVNIVGFANSWKLTPWDTPDTENWGLNSLHRMTKDRPWHAWFQLHDLEEHHGGDDNHLQWLGDFAGPVYMFDEHLAKYGDKIPNAVAYPREAITDYFGEYFTNSISWMIALAIFQGRKHIGTYGVDMAMDTEYSSQRPSCEYFLGWAKGAGITLDIPVESDLLKAPFLYGLETQGRMRSVYMNRKAELGQRKAELEGQIGQMNQQVGQATGALNQVLGAIEDTDYYIRAWSQSEVSLDGQGPTT